MPAMASNMAIWQFGRAGRVPMDGWHFSPFHHVYCSLETQCMIDRLSLLGAWAGDEAVSPVSSSPGVKPITHVVVVYLRIAKYQFVFLERKTYIFLEKIETSH